MKPQPNTLGWLLPQATPAELKAIYRLVYEDMVGSLPDKAKYIYFDDTITDDQDATYVGGFNTALDRTRTALDTKLQEVLETL
jgi:hypothetical protein